MAYTEETSQGTRLDAKNAIGGCLVGYIFGHVLYNSDLWYASNFAKNLKWEDTLLFKIIFSYIGISLILNSILSLTNNDHKVLTSREDGIILSLGGASMIGIGMYVAHTDPVMVLIQIGQGTVTPGTVTGILAAVCVVSLVGDKIQDKTTFSHTHLYSYIDQIKYWHLAMPLGGMMYSLAAVIDKPSSRFSKDAINVTDMVHSIQSLIPGADNQTWSPYTMGIVMAITQFVFRIVCEKRFQGYGGWITFISFPLYNIMELLNCDIPMFIRYTGSNPALWTFLMNLFVTIGAFATFDTLKAGVKIDVSATEQILGSFCFTFGAVVAGGDMFAMINGCTELHVRSILATFTMFLAAFITPIVYGEL